MATARAVFFPHRRNKDGSYDSICLSCFATVARSKTEQELVECDRNHDCDASTLAETRNYGSTLRMRM